MSAVGELIHAGSLPLPGHPLEPRFCDTAYLRYRGRIVNAWSMLITELSPSQGIFRRIGPRRPSAFDIGVVASQPSAEARAATRAQFLFGSACSIFCRHSK
jgi:hypothetical protein